MRHGQRVEGPLFLLAAKPNGRERDRLGLVLPRRLGDASARNRMKRLLREAFRRAARPPGARLDVLLLPRAEILQRSSEEVRHELEQRLRRLGARLARRPGADPGR